MQKSTPMCTRKFKLKEETITTIKEQKNYRNYKQYKTCMCISAPLVNAL